MSDFLIQIRNKMVQVSRIIDGEIELIRFSGENYTSLESFWDKFKRKIEYVSGEQLAFLVVTDQQQLDIDPDITVAEHFSHSNEDLAWLVGEANYAQSNIYCYPNIELNVQSTVVAEEQPTEDLLEEEMDLFSPEECSEVKSLQAFYRKKTRDYKRR
ncbi:hypothetical protein [Vibrio sp. CAU 1672]|uniref:hypothetical protein n=1 Tax=Vibrio sp. CAU 1672 TaxID=3032594 RepID=UPI0023DA589A|nr:hypothetical protein [Vibrio sp. CAU 1672]MDF2154512.1 hypothetical protein [Vibrio sp. CAU 1672]